MTNINISVIKDEEVEDMQTYVMNFRKKLFPMLDNSIIPQDIKQFAERYVKHENSIFLQAKDKDNNLIGVIGMMPYDHRFPYLNYTNRKTVEVARLFVEPSYRRLGLGSAMFDELLNHAKTKGIEVLYLHTHYFLTGAFEFWERQGFLHIYTSIDNEQETLHMEKIIEY